MRTYGLKLFFLQVSLLSTLACYAQSLASQPTLEPSVIVSDITAFWKAYDRFWQDTTKNPFEEYLEKGSVGLMDFIPTRIVSAQALKDKVKKESNYYDIIRSSKTDIHNVGNLVQQTFIALKQIYPNAVLPNVYLVIGRISSGGTATANGIIVGYETFCSEQAVTTGGRKSLPPEWIPALVAHELIHFQQHYSHTRNTLLKISLQEGCADFLAELMGYKEVRFMNGNAYEYGDKHEKELWERFSNEKESLDYSDWFYNSGRIKDIPSDLGYWMGYKICKAYYNNAQNKQQALKDMLQINDFEEFLRKSGYPLR
jgi:hypothetical protein